ncbi:MAG: hypothetical protein IJV40_13520 [Oscillospiraceae bacterium]|nr:hypothetical protein [Oscillospiraceae bacterium]
MAVDHLVLLVLDRKLLVQELREDMLTLADRVREELGIPLENTVVFSDTPGSETVGALSHWLFRSEKELKRFQKSRAHLEHLERMRPVLLDKTIVDRTE